MKKTISLVMMVLLAFSMTLCVYAATPEKKYTVDDLDIQEAKALDFNLYDRPFGKSVEKFDYSKYGSVEKVAPLIYELNKKGHRDQIIAILLNPQFEKDLFELNKDSYDKPNYRAYLYKGKETQMLIEMSKPIMAKNGAHAANTSHIDVYFGKSFNEKWLMSGNGSYYCIDFNGVIKDITYGTGTFKNFREPRTLYTDNVSSVKYRYLLADDFFTGKWELRVSNHSERCRPDSDGYLVQSGKHSSYMEGSAIYAQKGLRKWNQFICDEQGKALGRVGDKTFAN